MARAARFSWILIICCLLSACGVSRNARYLHFDPTKPRHHLRVVSYNINWREGSWKKNNRQSTVKAIKTVHADVLLLQETTAAWEKLLNRKLRRRFRYYRYTHIPNGGGLAIFSRYPILSSQLIPAKDGWYPAEQYLIKTPLGKIEFFNIHLIPTIDSPHPTSGLRKYKFYQSLALREQEIRYFYTKMSRRHPTIIAGDFNEGDTGESVKFLRKSGFVDATLQTKDHTWHWPMLLWTLASKYDRIFYSPELKAKKVQVLQEGSSDHYPLVVDFTK